MRDLLISKDSKKPEDDKNLLMVSDNMLHVYILSQKMLKDAKSAMEQAVLAVNAISPLLAYSWIHDRYPDRVANIVRNKHTSTDNDVDIHYIMSFNIELQNATKAELASMNSELVDFFKRLDEKI